MGGRLEGSYSQLGRCFALIRLLIEQDMTTHELASELGVTERQIRRDVTALVHEGLEMYQRESKYGIAKASLKRFFRNQ